MSLKALNLSLYPRYTNNRIYLSICGTNEPESSKALIITRYTHNKIILSTCDGTTESESSKSHIISPLYP